MHHVEPEMLDDDGNDLLDIDGMKLQVAGKGLCSLPVRHIRIVLDLLDQAEEAFVGRVALKHIHDKAFLDGLPQGVLMEGRCAGRAGLVEQGLGLEFRRSRESKEAEVRLPGALQRVAQHRCLRVVGKVVVLLFGELRGNRRLDAFLVQHALESGRGLAALGRMRLIDDDGEALVRRVDLHPEPFFSRVDSAWLMKGNFWIVVMTTGVPWDSALTSCRVSSSILSTTPILCSN